MLYYGSVNQKLLCIEPERIKMGFEDFITETEAASFTGVSVATLARFAEAGYLHVENDSDGLRLFSKPELKDVFGLQESLHKSIETVREPALHEAPRASSFKPPDMNFDREPYKHDHLAFESPDSVKKEAAPLSSAPKESGPPIVHLLEGEIAKLKNIVAMQEKILELKDQDNRSLREDRDWLRTRVERQEQKGERDQLLLLSETQMIRKLISINEPKKSSIRSALEWLGFVAPQPSMSSNTIDIVKRDS